MKPIKIINLLGLSLIHIYEEAIKVFAENLRQLLLASPLGQKRVMGIDPGFRTGCKAVSYTHLLGDVRLVRLQIEFVASATKFVGGMVFQIDRSEEHTSELQSRETI